MGQLKFSFKYCSFSWVGGSMCPVCSDIPKLEILASSTGNTLIVEVSVTSPTDCVGFRKTG